MRIRVKLAPEKVTYLAGKLRNVLRFWQIGKDFLMVSCEFKDFSTRKRVILGHVEVLDFCDFDGLLAHGKNVLHEEEVDRCESWQVVSNIDCQQANRKQIRGHLGNLLINFLLALVLGGKRCACDHLQLVVSAVNVHAYM